jgi:hypothetical protein
MFETISVSRLVVPLRTPSRSASPVAATANGEMPTARMAVARTTERVRGAR